MPGAMAVSGSASGGANDASATTMSHSSASARASSQAGGSGCDASRWQRQTTRLPARAGASPSVPGSWSTTRSCSIAAAASEHASR